MVQVPLAAPFFSSRLDAWVLRKTERSLNLSHAQLGKLLRSRTHSWKGQRGLAFRDTRVPVKALFENLEGGSTVDEFLEWFPGVTRHQVETVLDYAQSSLAQA